jgi:hypothetical protein
MWVIALVVAVVIAVIGVQTAINAVQRKQYAQDRATTVYFLRNGNSIATSMERLQELNAKDRVLMTGTRTALAAGDRARFNRLEAQADLNNDEQRSLRQQVKDYQEAFDKAFLR